MASGGYWRIQNFVAQEGQHARRLQAGQRLQAERLYVGATSCCRQTAGTFLKWQNLQLNVIAVG